MRACCKPPALPKATPKPQEYWSEKHCGSHTPCDAVTHATIEATDAFLHMTNLDHGNSVLPKPAAQGMHVAVGVASLARGTHALALGDGIEAKLEGMAAVGLGVASTASLFPSGAAAGVVKGAEAFRGASEVALGGYQLWHATHNRETPDSAELAHGILNCAKGVTTFLPLVAPGCEAAVGLLHLGIVGANLGIELSNND